MNRRLVDLVDSDVAAAAAVMEREPYQFSRRTYVRTVFAAIEAVVWSLKQSAVLAGGIASLSFSQAELALLKEKTYSLKPNGRAEELPARLRFEDNLKFALKIYARLHGAETVVDFGGPGFQALHRARKVRDRLTHPKCPDDLDVNVEEARDTFDGFKWVRDTALRIQQQGIVKMEEEIGRLTGQLAITEEKQPPIAPPSS